MASDSITKPTAPENLCCWFMETAANIADFKHQIEYFRKHYKVIAMDSRDQGKSSDSPDTHVREDDR